MCVNVTALFPAVSYLGSRWPWILDQPTGSRWTVQAPRVVQLWKTGWRMRRYPGLTDVLPLPRSWCCSPDVNSILAEWEMLRLGPLWFARPDGGETGFLDNGTALRGLLTEEICPLEFMYRMKSLRYKIALLPPPREKWQPKDQLISGSLKF